ncbi:MAG TPA: WecB/TagA/CpsF family glycosyltransferase [Bacteroidota bacterium]|nr:WecB/TagA/CpsF family glycosyltransferase [Bacteroidota bacterium]
MHSQHIYGDTMLSGSDSLAKYTARFGGVTLRMPPYDDLLATMLTAPPPALFAYAHFAILLELRRNPALAFSIGDCSLCYGDGTGTWLLLRRLGVSAPRINATEVNQRLLMEGISRDWRIAFLGGDDEQCSRLRAVLPRHGLAASRTLVLEGYASVDDEAVLRSLRDFAPQLLFVGMGTPKQFIWMHHHARELNIPITAAAGGFTAFLAGTRHRAPRWMRACGLEWLHRMMLEPSRLWRRYVLGIPAFLLLLSRAQRESAQ